MYAGNGFLNSKHFKNNAKIDIKQMVKMKKNAVVTTTSSWRAAFSKLALLLYYYLYIHFENCWVWLGVGQ